MIFFPNCKINIGLNICEKLSSGYHNLESIFYPVPWCDILEIMPSENDEFIFDGIEINCDLEQNLCYQAYRKLKDKYKIPSVKLYLHKDIPYGAGLGGGSSDAAFTIMGLNRIFSLQMSDSHMIEIANELGSDCAFFITNKPSYVTGTGNILSECSVNLNGHFLILIKPDFSISTREAYSKVVPTGINNNLILFANQPVSQWKNNIKNDFENPLFSIYPQLEQIKNQLYDSGALYASMSGSGSTIYGIFTKETSIEIDFPKSIYKKIAL